MFLFCVALSLILTGVFLPAEGIIIAYLPKFDPPANPYTGPEAGTEADRKSPPPGTTGKDVAVGIPPSPAGGGLEHRKGGSQFHEMSDRRVAVL